VWKTLNQKFAKFVVELLDQKVTFQIPNLDMTSKKLLKQYFYGLVTTNVIQELQSCLRYKHQKEFHRIKNSFISRKKAVDQLLDHEISKSLEIVVLDVICKTIVDLIKVDGDFLAEPWNPKARLESIIGSDLVEEILNNSQGLLKSIIYSFLLLELMGIQSFFSKPGDTATEAHEIVDSYQGETILMFSYFPGFKGLLNQKELVIVK
jgi:hypothetical protein